jgi:predicted nucleic acid-binding protein
LIALDTSVAVPLLVSTHNDHSEVSAWWNGRTVALCGHALAETYSVLTRLPGDLRHAPADAARLIRERFAPPLRLADATAARLPDIFAEFGIAGGSVYDALVALAAVDHDVTLASRDARARATYLAVGAHVAVVTTSSSR